MSDFEDDSDDLVRRAMNGSDLDSTGPSDDDSDDTSLLDSDDASMLSANSGAILEENRAEETEFHDGEDAEAFRGVSRHIYRNMILPMKRGAGGIFLNYNFHSQLSDEGRVRLGRYLASSGIWQMNVTLAEQQPTHLEHVFRGPFLEDHELKRLKVRHPEDSESSTAKLTPGDWESMFRYLKKAPLLNHLDLSYLDINMRTLTLLEEGLSRGVKLKTLGLTGLNISDDNALGHMLGSLNATKLETIDIVECKASVDTCTGLTRILEKGAPKLQIINLMDNAMNDECVKMLCAALAKNTTVTGLHLDDNDEISKEGLKALANIVFDTSSLEHIYTCNHTLETVTYEREAGNRREERPIGFSINADGHPGHGLIANKRHCKIALFVTNHNADDYEEHDRVDFNVQPFAGYEIEMIPYILDFFANRLEYSHASFNQFCVYELIRKWIVQVFSFPSAERVRLNAKMAELEGRIDDLETKNQDLETKNRDLLKEVDALRAENERLASENDALKSGTRRAGEGDGNAKKRSRPGK